MANPGVKSSEGNDWRALVERARGGDETALADLIAATKDRLYRFLLLLTADRATAQDVSQDTYLYALEHLGELREPGAFLTWLYRIARHRFLDEKKSRRNRGHESEEVLDRQGIAAAGADPETRLQVAEALSRMEAEDRWVILLVDLEGCSYREAGEVLGVSESALTSRVYRARERFQSFFSKA